MGAMIGKKFVRKAIAERAAGDKPIGAPLK
jgi:hypothetical protein